MFLMVFIRKFQSFNTCMGISVAKGIWSREVFIYRGIHKNVPNNIFIGQREINDGQGSFSRIVF